MFETGSTATLRRKTDHRYSRYPWADIIINPMHTISGKMTKQTESQSESPRKMSVSGTKTAFLTGVAGGTASEKSTVCKRLMENRAGHIKIFFSTNFLGEFLIFINI